MMVILTLIFVVLYTGALLGWLKPLSDVTLVTRLEPLIFTIIGYYFGRLPAQQNEETLKDEINRQTKKADAAQNSREQTQQEREALEEKLKNVQTILMAAVNKNLPATRGEKSVAAVDENNLEILQHSLKTAVNVLNS
ncbi:MAG: hypothetical protein LH472_04650 [Pyrinomonadaceae bacterium]|nr:hypothetical protein [Pyrinomonadaceae bacterium]